MLFSRMVGGLGNQLFQLAACLKYRNNNEKVIISFLGNIHKPKRNSCLSSIFEKPNWLYFDNSSDLDCLAKFVAKQSAALRFGSYLPLISINDRNFLSKSSRRYVKNIRFLDGYFNQKWTFNSLNNAFGSLDLKTILLNKENIQICNNDVVIHIRGGDFLNISHLNICQLQYYLEAISYLNDKGHNSFKVISEDQRYANEIIQKIKSKHTNIKISLIPSNTIQKDFNIIRSSKLAILSNSTFSWWASFFSKSKKEFIVPSNFSTKEKRIVLPYETTINF